MDIDNLTCKDCLGHGIAIELVNCDCKSKCYKCREGKIQKIKECDTCSGSGRLDDTWKLSLGMKSSICKENNF